MQFQNQSFIALSRSNACDMTAAIATDDMGLKMSTETQQIV